MQTKDLESIAEISIANFQDAFCFVDISKAGAEKAGRARLSGLLNHVLINFFPVSFVFKFTGTDDPAAFSAMKAIQISKGGE